MISGRKECTSGEQRCAVRKGRRVALYCQSTHSKLTRTDIAEAMGVNPATLSKWADPNGSENIPEERLIHLLQLTDDNPAFLSYYAHVQGFIVYDPKGAPKNVTRMVTEFGELLKAIDDATINDGAVTADQADSIEREGDELIGAVRKQIDEAKRLAARGPRAVERS